MKIIYGSSSTKKVCPLLFVRDVGHAADCLQAQCGIWDSRRGCCGLKQSPLPKCLAVVK